MDEKFPDLIRYSRIQCGKCGSIREIKEYRNLDLSKNPWGKAELLEGAFFQWRCPECGLESDAAWPCWYLDSEAGLGISLAPGIDSAEGEEAVQAMNRNLEGLSLPPVTRRVVGNFYAMQELVRAQDLGLDQRVVQLVKPLIIGQLQSQGEEVWNGFFQGVSTPEPESEPLHGVLYASQGQEMKYGQPIYWYDIHLTNRKIVHTGVNEMIFQMCQGMLEQMQLPPDGGTFHLYDLNWAIRCHNQMQNG